MSQNYAKLHIHTKKARAHGHSRHCSLYYNVYNGLFVDDLAHCAVRHAHDIETLGHLAEAFAVERIE